MASFRELKSKDGQVKFRAEIVIKKKGKIVHRESKVFQSEKAAKKWAFLREDKLKDESELKSIISKNSKKKTIKELMELYEAKVGKIKSWGRSKQAVINSWKNRDEGETLVDDVTASWIIDFCIKRKSEEGAKPATINSDIAILRSVFSVARDLLGIDVGLAPFIDARPTLGKLDLVGKSNERDRRPTVEEMSEIVDLAHESSKSSYFRDSYAPCDKIFVFQMFSGRRISETCRLKWNELDHKNKRALITGMKSPTKKEGNDVWVLVPDPAWDILLSMPKIEGEERIFPFDSKTISTRFDRMRAKAGLFDKDTDNNLRLHDLRHEALSWLAEKNGLENENWDIPRIQLVSGHKNWNVLQRYVNLLESKPHDKWKDWEWTRKVLE